MFQFGAKRVCSILTLSFFSIFFFLFELVGMGSKSSIFLGLIVGGCGFVFLVELAKRCTEKRSDPDSELRISRKGVSKVSPRRVCIGMRAGRSTRFSRQSKPLV